MLNIILLIEDEHDRHFVEELYINYSEKMYLIANDILHNHHDSENCVHDTVKSIIDNLPTFKNAQDETALKKLVYISCKNNAITKYRANKKRNENTVSLTHYNEKHKEYEVVDVIDEEAYVDDIVINEHNCKVLREIINELEPKYKDVIILKSMDLSADEISKIMNISPDSVRQRYFRAKKLILKLGEGRFDAIYEKE